MVCEIIHDWMVHDGNHKQLKTIHLLCTVSLCSTRLRRIEDKLDSRQLASQLITVRMEPPPSSKRVAMTVFGWVVWQEDNYQNNIFKDCQLLQDRLG